MTHWTEPARRGIDRCKVCGHSWAAHPQYLSYADGTKAVLAPGMARECDPTLPIVCPTYEPTFYVEGVL